MQEFDFIAVKNEPSLLEDCDMIFGVKNEDQDHLYGINLDEKKIVHEDPTG